MTKNKDGEPEESLASKKAKGLLLVVGNLEKQFGKGIIVSGENVPDVEFNSTGCKSLDRALGGGFAKGRVAEIYGPESSGKTTLALSALAKCQTNGGTVAFVDMEHAVDPGYAANLGVNMETLLLSQPDSGEQGLEVVEQLVRSGSIDMVVLDSVAALTPQKEIEGDMGDQHMGLQARLMSQALRKLTAITAKTGCTLIFINQIRMKIGLVFGNPETTTGGNSLKFYASQRIEVRRSGVIKTGEGDDIQVVGNQTKVKVVKNKVFPPFRECEFIIRYGTGIDTNADLLGLAVQAKVIEKSGAWYSYKGTKLGQGEENAIASLRENQTLRAEIEAQV